MSRISGDTNFSSLTKPENSINTIVINGIDKDLLITTNQLIVKTDIQGLKKGIALLKTITNVSRVLFIVSPDLAGDAQRTGADVKVIDPIYPNALPETVMKILLGEIVPTGMSCEEMGVCFINAEAVSAMATALDRKEMPVNKILTVISKDGTSLNVKARIGTPVKDILKFLQIETHHGDRLVLGGPMTGTAIYSEDIPVLSDTDAIMVQDKDQIVMNSESHCVNCGECVRACPTKVPVNMLVRLLENGLYEEAAEQYDLLSCIECGLCAYACVARIPVFHYIMLGKFEYERIKSAEEANA